MQTHQPETATTTITTVEETSRENSTEDDTNTAADQQNDISQLAAQIASFVRTADTDRERLRNGSPDKCPPTPPTRAATVIDTARSTTVVHIVDVHQQQHQPSPPASPLRRQLPSSARDSPESNGAYPDSRTPTPSREGSRDRCTVPVHDTEKQLNTLERVAPLIIVRSATTDDEDEDDDNDDVVLAADSLERKPLPAVPEAVAPVTKTTTTTTTSIVHVVEQPRRQTPVVHSLLIAESCDDLSSSVVGTPATDISLKIVESVEDVRQPVNTTPPVVAADSDRYKIRFVALRPMSEGAAKPAPSPHKPKWTAPWSSSGKPKPAASQPPNNGRIAAEVKTNNGVQLRRDAASTADNDDEASDAVAVAAPPRRRRSVKDIIESINKCQSLLRINQSDAADSLTVDKRVTSLETIDHRSGDCGNNNNNNTIASPSSPSSESIARNLSELQASEQHIRQTIAEMEQQRTRNGNDRNNNAHNGHSNGNATAESADVLQQLPIMVERYAEFSSEFKKCAAGRSAATSSPVLVRRREKVGAGEAETLRTDWNPLPKPRRSRHLTHEQASAAEPTQ